MTMVHEGKSLCASCARPRLWDVLSYINLCQSKIDTKRCRRGWSSNQKVIHGRGMDISLEQNNLIHNKSHHRVLKSNLFTTFQQYQLSFTTYRSCWTFKNSNSSIFKHVIQSFHEILLDVVWRERKWKENFLIFCHRFATSRSINCSLNEIAILKPISCRIICMKIFHCKIFLARALESSKPVLIYVFWFPNFAP